MRPIITRLPALFAVTCGLLLTSAAVGHAQAYAGASVLQDPISARAAGMGFTGAADNSDPANVWFNPANAVAAPAAFLDYGFREYFPFPDVDIEIAYRRWAAGGSFSLTDGVDAGVAATFGELNYGSHLATDAQGTPLGYFESWERYASLTLAVAARVGRVDLRLGVAGKWFWSQYASSFFTQPVVADGDGLALDVGTAAALPVDVSGWTVTPALGFAYVNFGGDIEFSDGASDPFPARLHYGASVRVDGPSVALGPAHVPIASFVQNVDVTDRLHDDAYSWGMGAEVAVLQILFLRAGSDDDQDKNDFDRSAWSIGLGTPVGPFRARFDYAHDSFNDEPRYDFVASWGF